MKELGVEKIEKNKRGCDVVKEKRQACMKKKESEKKKNERATEVKITSVLERN